jgi:transcriptional regulator with XRE-family HTH domain
MDLALLIQDLLNNQPIGVTATAANVSAGGLHNLVSGKVKEPQPQTLARLARYFGSTDAERRLLYAEMMQRSGYFDLLPKPMLASFDELRTPYKPESDAASNSDESLFEEVAAILEQADKEQRVRLALDVLRRFYPEEAQTVLENLQAQREKGSAASEVDR